MMSVTFFARVGAQGGLVAEVEQCFGFDTTASSPAPLDKGVRAHVCFDHADPLLLDAFLRLLGSCEPKGVGAMPSPIGEDAPK